MSTKTNTGRIRAADAATGIAGWNRMTERQRRAALLAADTAIPTRAFDHWRLLAGRRVC